MQTLIAIVFLIFMVGYVIPNIFRYPWHTLVFIVVGVGIALIGGGGERLMARLKASAHPAARRYMMAHTTFFAIFEGVPPYDAARWWVVRTLVQGAFWIVTLAAAATMLFAIGMGFHWIETS